MQRVCFPVGGTHLSLTAGRSRRGSASQLAPGRAAPGAQRCRPGAAGGWKRRLPSPRTAGARSVRGSPRPDGGAGPLSRGHRGEAAAPRGRPRGLGPRAGGRRGTCLTTRAGSWWGEEAGHMLGIAGKGGLRGAPALGGGTRGHTRGAGRQDRVRGAGTAEAAPQTHPRPCVHLGCAGGRGHRGDTPAPTAQEPAGKSALYLEEGTDLILLQVGLDPRLLVRRHEELRGRGLELVSPGGGCSPSGCWRLAPPLHKGCHSGRGRRRCRSARDGANSGNWGRGKEPGASRPLSRARGWQPSGSSGRALPGAEHGAGRRGATRAALELAPLRAACVCQSVSVCVSVPGSALVTGAAAAQRCRPRHSAAAEADSRGLLSAPRPPAPVDARARRTKGGSGGRGRRAGGRRGLLCLRRSPARPAAGLPPAEPQPPPLPADACGAPTWLRCPGRGERRGPPGVRPLSGTRKLRLGKVAEERNESRCQQRRGMQGLQPALFLNFCLNYL